MTVVIDGTTGITAPALDSDGNLEYSGTFTGGTGVVNIGSGQVIKDASGNLGLGVTPTQRLHVSGSILGTQSITIGSNGLYQAGSIYSDVNWGMILRAKQASPGQANFGFMNSAGSEFMRIDPSGNLLVGMTSAYDGSAKIQVLMSGQNTGITTKAGSTSASYAIGFYNPNGVVGGIVTNASATAYNTSSDYRLKENVAPMTGALATVAALKPCTYTWKADGSAGQGFIAHELQTVVPDCVTGTKDAIDAEGKPQYQGVDTSFLVATLVAAIQEQQATIAAMETRLAALEA